MMVGLFFASNDFAVGTCFLSQTDCFYFLVLSPLSLSNDVVEVLEIVVVGFDSLLVDDVEAFLVAAQPWYKMFVVVGLAHENFYH